MRRPSVGLGRPPRASGLVRPVAALSGLHSAQRGVLRSCGTFCFFSILFFLTAWACLLLGFFLSCHLGFGGSFSVAPQEGLPELLGI